MGVTYSYTFPTGLTVSFGQKEKNEIEGMLKPEMDKIDAEHKKEWECPIHWSESNIGVPYREAMKKYFKHEC